jgi:hypothetical protein
VNSRDLGIVMVFGIAGLVAISLFLRPLVRAWARRIGGEATSPALADEVLELQARVAELEAERGHLHELEERLEFAERLLARRNDPAPLQAEQRP